MEQLKIKRASVKALLTKTKDRITGNTTLHELEIYERNVEEYKGRYEKIQDEMDTLLSKEDERTSHDDYRFSMYETITGIAGLPEAGRKQMSAPLEIPKEDKYAALKDLDLTMKQQQLGTTPTKPDSQHLNGDISSGSNGWPSGGGGGGGLFGSPSGSALFPNATASLFPSAQAATYGASPNGFGAAFGANGSMFSSNNSSMFGSPSTNGSLFGSPGGRSTDSPLTSGGGEVANPFGVAAAPANPFRSNLSSDMGWPSQAVPSSGSLMNGGFPISQSMDFSAKAQWPMVNHHIANPFKMNTAAPQTTAPHHSSNPFL